MIRKPAQAAGLEFQTIGERGNLADVIRTHFNYSGLGSDLHFLQYDLVCSEQYSSHIKIWFLWR